jgi:hypothetical protein
MESRLFNTTVVVVWLSAMSWLVVAKVLPPLRRGDPPNYASVYSQAGQFGQTIHWNVLLDRKQVGRARTVITPADGGVTEVSSEVSFHRLPLAQLAPAWVRALMGGPLRAMDNLGVRATSRLEIDALGRLSTFRSEMSASGMNFDMDPIIVDGIVKGSVLHVRLRNGSSVTEFERPLPSDALLGDEMSPLARMPGLRLGQQWTVPVMGPLSPAGKPCEILQAKVESAEQLVWNDQRETVLVVVYRQDEGALSRPLDAPRARLYVRPSDGLVLRQDANLYGTVLSFVRSSPMPREAAEVKLNLERWAKALQDLELSLEGESSAP